MGRVPEPYCSLSSPCTSNLAFAFLPIKTVTTNVAIIPITKNAIFAVDVTNFVN